MSAMRGEATIGVLMDRRRNRASRRFSPVRRLMSSGLRPKWS